MFHQLTFLLFTTYLLTSGTTFPPLFDSGGSVLGDSFALDRADASCHRLTGASVTKTATGVKQAHKHGFPLRTERDGGVDGRAVSISVVHLACSADAVHAHRQQGRTQPLCQSCLPALCYTRTHTECIKYTLRPE